MRTLSLAQVAHILKCEGFFPSHHIKGYCTDSRLLNEGELFFALKGLHSDGHDFLHEIKQKGAVAAVVSKNYQGDIQGLRLLFVEDPLIALQNLACTSLARSSTRVAAITGSIGKTTTKEFTRILLSAKYRVSASPGNSNSQVGLPLAILNHSSPEDEILVLEMGMTEKGQLARLVQIAPPEIAAITYIALVHACGFQTLEDIALTKGEIFSSPKTKMGILHCNIPCYEDVCRIGTFPKHSFSTTSEADYHLDPHHPDVIVSRLDKKAIPMGPLPVPGKHNIHNLMAAIGIARYFGVCWEEIQRMIPALVMPEKRLQFVRKEGILFLNDSYNASEVSVKAALETLAQVEGVDRKIAVLGSMMELGKFSEECHRNVAEHSLKYVESMFCLGEECKPIFETWRRANRPVRIFTTREDLVSCLKNELKPGDAVLLKGSRSKQLWKVLEEL